MSLPKWINHSVDAFIEMLALVDHYVFGHDYDLPVTDAGAERLEAEVDHLEPRVFDARDENAIALLKVDPDKFFAITNLCLPKPERDKAIADALKAARDEDAAWEANELYDRRFTVPAGGDDGAPQAWGRAVLYGGGGAKLSTDWVPVIGDSTFSLLPGAAESSPLAGVQRAASPEGVSDETPDTPPPSGHTDADDQPAPQESTPTSALLYAAMNFLTWGMEFDAGHPFITELKDRAARFTLCESGPISVDLDDLDAHITAIRTTWLNCHHLGLPTPTLSHEIAADLLANYHITRK